MSFDTITLVIVEFSLGQGSNPKAKVSAEFTETIEHVYPGGSSTQVVSHGNCIFYVTADGDYASLTGAEYKAAIIEKVKLLLPKQGTIIVQ